MPAAGTSEMTRFTHALALLGGLALAGCQAPPPAAYLADQVRSATGEPAGENARGEPCMVTTLPAPALDQPVARANNLFCGGWSQPAARLVTLRGDGTDAATLQRLATGGLWRQGLEERLLCTGVEQTRLAGGTPAVLLRCVRRRGGWPHMAMVLAGREGPVLVDGLATTLPVVERLVNGGGGERTAGRSAAMEIAVARLSAEAYGAADASRFEQLMALGHDLNQAEKFAAAEEAYRAALAIQQQVIGADNPDTAGPLMALALNVSSQGRDAAPLFERAAQLAPRAVNPLLAPRLLQYRGMDLLNRDDAEAALPLLQQAEAAYARLSPTIAQLDRAEAEPGSALILDTLTQSAVLGVAESRRYRGVALARLRRPEEALPLLRDARRLLRNAGLDSSVLVGRNLRSRGNAVDQARAEQAARYQTAAAARFASSQPGERPEAVTLFLAGQRLLAAGERAEAMAYFADGEAILRRHKLGLPAEVVMPYLDALAEDAAARPAEAPAIHARMFGVSQLARSEATSRLVAQAAARLNAAAADSRVGQAIRRLQESELALRGLLQQRDQLRAPSATLDAQIAQAQAARAAAEDEVAAAAPGYRQLLMAVADAPDTAAVLAPDEALVTMLLGPAHGYAFALRSDGRVQAQRIALAEKNANMLVTRLRASTQPGQQGLPRFDLGAAAQLYRALFSGLAPALEGAQSLLVAADGPLLSIPFNLLVAGTPVDGPLAAQPWLVRRMAVVHVPSAQTLVTMRGAGARAASTAPLAYAGFGNPVMPNLAQLSRSFPASRCANDARLAASLGPLPGTAAEVAAAAKAAGARVDALKLGPAFTQAALRAQPLEQYRVLHFATHSLMSGELHCLNEPSMIVSSPTNAPDAAAAFVPASALMELRLDANLVILSACNTGTTAGGRDLGGEGLSALVRASFFAGARGVLATHWVIDDDAAARMVSDLVASQSAGQGSAAALRRVQLAMLDGAGRGLPERWAHPYYWAPFALLGDGLRAQQTRS